ncbi:ester cyclase [Roseiterribacter gracilis]
MTDAVTVVRGFLDDVRSGRAPDHANRYMAASVRAHQIESEGETTVLRTPADYAAHVREFLDAFGAFTLEVTECFGAGDKVYARWRQTGRHLASLNGETPTGAPLISIASCVYRVEDGRIAEYWIQVERKGMELQLERLAA